MYRFALTLLTLGLVLAQPPQRGVRTSIPITVQRKLALVVGNAKYAESPLRNSINDATAFAQALRSLKFDEVTERHDLSIRQLRQEIDSFAKRLHPGDLGLFYFAGHGMQVDEQNYLIPIDFAGSESDLPYEAYPAAQLRDKLQSSGARLRVIILDSCRNNPFRTKRDGTRGLAPMSSAEGTFIAYATAENGVADDGAGSANGLFTGELLQTLRTPGLDLKAVFERTKEAVYLASGGKQRPYTSDGVVGQFYFLGAETIANNPPPTATPAPSNAAPTLGHPSTVRRAGETKIGDNGLTYVWIPPGTFAMGCSQDDKECYSEESPSHRVTITKGFWIGQTPVTQAAYQRVIGTKPSSLKGSTLLLPVETISWNDAQAYCAKAGMRLPTEAEWEYAARAGSTASRYGPLDDVAWYNGNSDSKTHPVGQKLANAWGLFDMLGNVWQWTADWYDEYYYQHTELEDPTGAPGGTKRVTRGGSWNNLPRSLRLSYRGWSVPEYVSNNSGVRCAGD